VERGPSGNISLTGAAKVFLDSLFPKLLIADAYFDGSHVARRATNMSGDPDKCLGADCAVGTRHSNRRYRVGSRHHHQVCDLDQPFAAQGTTPSQMEMGHRALAALVAHRSQVEDA
jgi:hypothetical protein